MLTVIHINIVIEKKKKKTLGVILVIVFVLILVFGFIFFIVLNILYNGSIILLRKNRLWKQIREKVK